MSVAENAFAVILGGGAGTRLWPSSRRARPKQLLSLGAPESLLAAAVRRGRGDRRSRAHAGRHRRRSGGGRARRGPRAARRRTSSPSRCRATRPPPSAWARWSPQRRAGPDAVIAVLPADPFIADEADVRAPGAARDRRGARRPSSPSASGRPTPRPASATSGWARACRAPGADAVHDVGGFVEKPDRPTAERYLASGDYLWNSGMFFLTARPHARRSAPPPARAGRAARRARSPPDDPAPR